MSNEPKPVHEISFSGKRGTSTSALHGLECRVVVKLPDDETFAFGMDYEDCQKISKIMSKAIKRRIKKVSANEQ